MTVGELVAKLIGLPPDATVEVLTDEPESYAIVEVVTDAGPQFGTVYLKTGEPA